MTKKNKIFGGFTTVNWDTSGYYKSDTNSFIFSVDLASKYPHSGDNAIYCGSSYGPSFGGGHDISINNNPNTSDPNYLNVNHTYKNIPLA